MFSLLVIAVVVILMSSGDVNGNDNQFFIKSATPKKIPLLGKRSKNNNMDFEKFFLKASKSVPRIGRTEQQVDLFSQSTFDINAHLF